MCGIFFSIALFPLYTLMCKPFGIHCIYPMEYLKKGHNSGTLWPKPHGNDAKQIGIIIMSR